MNLDDIVKEIRTLQQLLIEQENILIESDDILDMDDPRMMRMSQIKARIIYFYGEYFKLKEGA